MPIRRAVPADAPAIARVHVAAWQTAYRGLIPDDFLARLDVDRRAADWFQVLTDPAQQPLILEQGDELCGFVSFGPARDDDLDHRLTGEIYALYVSPTQWRRGLGRQLCTAAIDRLSAAGFREATLWVFEGNPPARRFYESVGFHPDGTTRIETRGVPLTIVRYRRRV